MFQQYNLLPSLTAAENACLPLLVSGRPRRAAINRAHQVLEQVGLGGKANTLPAACQEVNSSAWPSRGLWCTIRVY